MTDSDGDIICIDTSTKPEITDDEIQQYIDLIVDVEIVNGRDPFDLSLGCSFSGPTNGQNKRMAKFRVNSQIKDFS